MLTVEEIRKTYKQFEDWKIKELALNPKALRKEIIPILNEEIKNRNLGIDLITWVQNETNIFEGLEKKNLIQKITRSKCSLCSENSNLSGYRFTTIFSALIILTNKTESLIICNSCAKSKRLDSMLKTLVFGWWSRKGILLTPFALVSDLIRIFRPESDSKKVFDEFIENNTGELRLALEKNNLEAIIEHSNNRLRNK